MRPLSPLSEMDQWRKKMPKCCFCIDVRLGTLILAVIQIIIHLIAVAGIVALIFFPSTIHELVHHWRHCSSENDILNRDMNFIHENHHEHHINNDIFDKPEKQESLHPIRAVASVMGRSSVQNKKASVSQLDINFLRPEEYHHPRHLVNLNLIAFGHRQTIVLKGNEAGQPTIFLSRFFAFPRLMSDLEPNPNKENNVNKNLASAAIGPNNLFNFANIEAIKNNLNHLNEHQDIISAVPSIKDYDIDNNNISHKNKNEHAHHHGTMHWFSQCTKHLYWDLVVVWLSLGFCILMFYGAKMNRAVYLLPYFTLQVFGYIMASFTVVGYLSYLPHVKFWISQQCHIPWKHTLLSMNNMALGLILLSGSLFVLAAKAYLMGMVWTCYRHLHAGQRLQRLISSRGVISEADVVLNLDVDVTKQQPPFSEGKMSLPEYEKCLAMPANKFMPPPYFEAIPTVAAVNEAADDKAALVDKAPTVDSK